MYTPPIANAGPDQTISNINLFGAVVQLDGTRNTDPDGDTLSYSRSGTNVTLTDPHSSTPMIETPGFALVEFGNNIQNKELTFQLKVDDCHNATNSSIVHITLIPVQCKPGEVVSNSECQLRAPPNTPPVANAGPDQVIDETNANPKTPPPVVLDGTASTDPDGDILTYLWQQIGGNTNDHVAFDNATFPKPVFELGLPSVNFNDNTHNDTLTFQLTVNDGHGNTATNEVHVTIIPHHCGVGEAAFIGKCRPA